MKNITPLGDRILVKVQMTEEKTAGGIYIPDTAQEKTQEGVVVAVGDSQDIKVKNGDKIIYAKYSGTEIKIDGSEHLILKSEDILAKIS